MRSSHFAKLVRLPLLAMAFSAAAVWAVLFLAWSAGTLYPQALREAPHASGPAVGDLVVDFVLKDLDGKPWHLRDHLGAGPIVIEFGNLT
jgi:cytochrome oxidase Cu insertion factor (SCO1/SenC/PrrC family)